MLKNLFKTILKYFPFKSSLIKFAAKAPIELKSRFFFRIVSNLSQYCNPKSTVLSNFGINNNFRIIVNIEHQVQAFGSPILYTPEYSTLELTSKLMQHTDAFFDIGSHIGYFSYYIENKNIKSKPIYFFEPDPDLFKRTHENVNKNQLLNVNGFELALSNLNGELIFYKNNSDSYSGSIKNTFEKNHNVQEVKVKTTTFDSFVQNLPYQTYTIKVDVESAEADFLEGCKNEISKVSYLIIELLQDAIEQNLPNYLIKSLGFNAFYIHNFELVHSVEGDFNYYAPFYNWLFTKDSIEELQEKLKDSQFSIKQ